MTPTPTSTQEADMQRLHASWREEQQLRNRTHQILRTTGHAQQRLSLQLHDEIMQMLLGLQVSLITVQQQSTAGRAEFQRALLTPQRLAKQSVRIISRFARELTASEGSAAPLATGTRLRHAASPATGPLLQKSRHRQEELRRLSHSLLSTQEKRRRQISRGLHGIVVHALADIDARLAALKTVPQPGSQEIQSQLSAMQRLVEKSVALVQRFACELHPTVLEDLGLIPALQSHLRDFMAHTGIQASLTVYAGVAELGSDVRTPLYRIVQEALATVSQHAHASRARVGIHRSGEMLRMEIATDGAPPKARKSLGLPLMRERAQMLGGTFSLIAVPGQETIVCVEIPLHNARTARRTLKPTPPHLKHA